MRKSWQTGTDKGNKPMHFRYAWYMNTIDDIGVAQYRSITGLTWYLAYWQNMSELS